MRPPATLSLDLDDEWSYLKIHGDLGWEDHPSYLETLVPKVLELLQRHDLRITIFVVGADAARPRNREVLGSLAEDGHEIGNHSFSHDSWLHLYTEEEIDGDLARAEEAIVEVTGVTPEGFRGPGFSLSRAILSVLADRGYAYDASTLPTFLGPLARAYYLRTADLGTEEREKREHLFGRFRDGFRPLRPYRWEVGDRSLTEIPVTTFPLVKTPIHVSYLMYVALFSPALARLYFRTALSCCRLSGIAPSLLLHPLDFLGADDVSSLAFFPTMERAGDWKLGQLERFLRIYLDAFDVGPIGRRVTELNRERLALRRYEATGGLR